MSAEEATTSIDSFEADYTAQDVIAEDTTEEPQLFYPSLDQWVEDWLSIAFIRKDSQQIRWCKDWWAHPEAVIVLSALWEAWEIQRVGEPGSSARFLNETFYPLLDRLTSANGTFQLCSPDKGHTDLVRLQEEGYMPTTPPPADIMAYIGGNNAD